MVAQETRLVSPCCESCDWLDKNHKYGRLKIVAEAGKNRYRQRMVSVLCECGNKKTVIFETIRSGKTKSCGCLQREKSRRWWIENNPTRTHGGSKSLEYHSWMSMRVRCRNPKDPYFYLYGGRGVAVCKRWGKYENFIKDMGSKPSAKHSIDRINPYGNYEPSNCRWATPLQQRHNRRVK